MNFEEEGRFLAPHTEIMESLAVLIYPSYAHVIQRSSLLPLSSKSLIVKACQAQKWPSDREDTLYKLMALHSDVPILSSNISTTEYVKLLDWAYEMDIVEAITDPLESCIILDIMRALPLPSWEIQEAKLASWCKEIVLAEGIRRPSNIQWRLFFNDEDPTIPIADDLPPNPGTLRSIRRVFKQLREHYTSKMQEMWPRATHKNMSRDTRREYELSSREDISDVPIFGQDDWARYYESTGIPLPGACEIRQKWYPSGVKPRTYFAMGGTAYRPCRHLQDFFTSIVNLFAPTHHVHRLRPQRLVIDPDIGKGPRHFFIYDLINFTSNMAEQRYFVRELGVFLQGVEVMVMDEREGPVCKDLGEMILEYEEFCVSEPLLTYERFDQERRDSVPHGVASLLGIFGNLMTCTLSHFLIISPVTDGLFSTNIAGDDGIVPQDEFDTLSTNNAICHVGDYAPEKCFRGDEDSPICLKRPFREQLPGCHLLDNLMPPPIALAAAYLNPYIQDPRYSSHGLADISKGRRISTLGKDLLRFLEKAHRIGYSDIERLDDVLEGFRRAVVRLAGVNVHGPSTSPIWPCQPTLCNGASPQLILLLYSRDIPSYIPVHQDTDPAEEQKLIFEGDEVLANTSKRIRLLERLGYLTIQDEFVDVVTYQMRFDYWHSIFVLKLVYPPKVFRITVVKDIPRCWL